MPPRTSKSASFKEVSIPVAWGKLQVRIWGPSNAAQTIVALHGWLDNVESFTPMLAEIPEGTRWICIDMAGHGKSQWRPQGLCYHFFDYIQDLADVVRELKLESFHLVGHSLGAGVAGFFAGAFPKQVKSLSCLDSLGPLPFSPSELPSHYREFREQWNHLIHERKIVKPVKSVSRAVAARMMAGPISAQAAEMLMRRNLKKSGEQWQWKTDPRLKLPTAYRVTEEQVQAFLKAIECPVLIIEAENGIVSKSIYRQQRLSCFKNASLLSVPGEHHVHMDHPERVLPLLVDFLAKHSD